MIAPELAYLARPLALLREDPRNANRHDTKNLEAIAASLAAFGQQKPIVALADGTVIAGNGTLRAARSLGWAEIAVVTFEDESRARAFALADNRSAQLAEWDLSELGATLEEVGDMTSFGFSKDDLDSLGIKSDIAATFDDRYLEDIDPTPAPMPLWALVSAPPDMMPLVVEAVAAFADRGVRIEAQHEHPQLRA